MKFIILFIFLSILYILFYRARIERINFNKIKKFQIDINEKVLSTKKVLLVLPFEKYIRELIPNYLKFEYVIGVDLMNKLNSSLFLCFLMIITFFLVFDISPNIVLLLLFSTIVIYFIASSMLYNRKRHKLIESLPQAIDILISVLKSGHSVHEAVKAASLESVEPLNEELNLVLRKLDFGLSFNDAFRDLCQYYNCFELDLLNTALRIQGDAGGSLSNILQNTNNSIKTKLDLKSKIKILTAQSKLTAIIVGVLPFALAAFLEFVQPGYLSPLYLTELGKNLLIAAFTSLVIGILIMLKLSYVKI